MLKHLMTAVLIGLGLSLGLSAMAQEGALTPAELDRILEETDAAGTIANLAQVLIGPEEFDEKVIAYGVLLKIAQEVAFPELDLQGWFKEHLGEELKQTDLARFDLVRRALKTHPDLYKRLQEELAQLAPPPTPAPEPETGAGAGTGTGTTTPGPAPDLARLARQLEEFNARLATLEERVSQLLPGDGEESELAQLRQEVERLKERLPEPGSLQALEDLNPRLQGLEERVRQMSSSLGGLRGLVLFLLVLVILMLIWMIYLRVRELSRSFR